jgi:hypothetical protein
MQIDEEDPFKKNAETARGARRPFFSGEVQMYLVRERSCNADDEDSPISCEFTQLQKQPEVSPASILALPPHQISSFFTMAP